LRPDLIPHIDWPLRNGRPCIQVILMLAQGGQPLVRNLLADTGAGSVFSRFELILDEDDCLLCGGNPLLPIMLGGAYASSFPVYVLPVQVPMLGFSQNVRAVGVHSALAGFDGIAGFSFVNRFHYGNFGNPGGFGLAS
jgi:hypothetical protein